MSLLKKKNRIKTAKNSKVESKLMDFESINILSVGINAIATVALVIATIILANFNKKLWLAQDKPWLAFYVKNLDFGFIDGPLPIVLYAKNFGACS